ncbi:restriction endonuclease subunit S [Pantoea dispersa]|jgi:type I restriction enzyme S subunit|uniref:restriction endonuclease subunit S n=1 Tax=Pantoea dispersa TaxID=59814 RepID=UPI003D1DE29A
MVPKLRFSKFSKEWTKIRLGDYLQNYQKKVSSDTAIPVYSSSRQGLKPQAEYFADRELQNDGEYGVVPFGYITYRHMSDDNTFHFNLNNRLPEIAVSKEYPVFTGKDLNNYFLLSKLNHTDEFKLFAIQQKAGGTRTRLYFKNLCEWRATFPELEEQIQISDFLSSVDERIKLLSNQYDLLCRYKKGMMQKIFSQEVRFKDENGKDFPEWKQKKIREITSLIKDGTHGTHNNVTESDFFLLSAKNIQEGKVAIDKNDRKISEIEFRSIFKNYNLEPGDILLSVVGTIGRVAIYSEQYSNYAFQRSVAFFRFPQEIPEFIYQLFNATKFQKELLIRQVISAQPGIYLGDLADISLEIPVQKEQMKIANFLSTLDDKIAVTKAALDKLKIWKQGLLQQMFV